MLEEMVHEVDIIYNQLPGKLPTLNSSELMADNVGALRISWSSFARKTALGKFDDHHHHTHS